MADQEAISVSIQARFDHPQKRKLEDLDPPPTSTEPEPEPEPEPDVAASVPALDLTLGLEGELKHGDHVEGENGKDEAWESSKRPRLGDETPDGLASANGHKPDEGYEHATSNAEIAEGVENAVTTVGSQDGGDEHSNEAVLEEWDKVQPASESEQKVDAEGDNLEGKGIQVPSSENEQLENAEKPSRDELHKPATEVAEQGDGASGQHLTESGIDTRKIEIPNNKVGVLIGKAGDTIKYLQISSGAKIQITRDADADPHSPTRPVELVGTLESLNKAEKLIKDVIAEAEAGGLPSLVARGFTATMTAGPSEPEMDIPSDKVGLIIGKGGETIRNLQTRSGARIQLIPQSFPGDQSKEKKLKVTGDKKQVEMAKQLIKEVMNQRPGRQSQFFSNNLNQQAYRPRGPGGASQWGIRGPQPMPYDHHQRQPYPGQSYATYPPQAPPRGNFSSGWEHRPPVHGPPHGGGYSYCGQGGGHAANAPVSAPQSAHMTGLALVPSTGPLHSQANYNYGQPRGADYAQLTPYPQTAPPAQSYGHGYGEPKYDSQGQAQQHYCGPGYAPQQSLNRPQLHYGVPPHGGPSQGYAFPAASHPSNTSYQAAPVSAPQPYSQNMPLQQYPYASGSTTHVPYASAPVTNDGYARPQPVAAYGQQAAAGYPQAAAPTAGYGQYPSAPQAGYSDLSAGAPNAATYNYQGQVDQSAYGPTVARHGCAQPRPISAQPGYDQSAAPQSGGYASAPASAPSIAYGKTVSLEPGYPQYDASQQMYVAPR